jgi:hypothetical protein
MSNPSAKTPSANETSFDIITVAKVEPSAIVTTKSKEFHFDKVRLPEASSKTINAA